YNEAPKYNTETLFIEKVKSEKLDDEMAEMIEDLIADLSDEYERDQFNVQYLYDLAKSFFVQRHLEEHQKQIKTLLENGEIDEATKLAYEYNPIKDDENDTHVIDLSNQRQLFQNIDKIFEESQKPLFTYSGAAGELMNEFLARDNFIAFLAPEKRGKSIHLLDLALRAARFGCNVAFFQAGDMSSTQQMRRIAINRTKKNDKSKYAGKQFVTVKDCIHNQLNTCEKKEREVNFGLFEDENIERNDLTKERLVEAFYDNPDYSPCTNCAAFKLSRWGSPYMKEVDLGNPLTPQEAKKVLKKFFVDKKRRFKIATYPSETLTPDEVDRQLGQWEKEEGFIADVCIIDYADIMTAHVNDFRQKQNYIWSSLRGISHKRHLLLATGTQGDTKSYKSKTLTMENFSEDKRKIAHATAIIGINQDFENRLKNLKLAELNIVVMRDGDFDPYNKVTIIQSLAQGIAIKDSFW
ncbi:MAG: hypothetical protein ACLFUH_10435, partial [Bacteroidales bacterium]